MLRVEAFAAPYREPNSYGETFATRAFAGKLHPVEAGVMHEGPVGVWDEVWEDNAGIWARGCILHPLVLADFARFKRLYPELSVSWCCADFSKARDNRRCLPGSLYPYRPCVVGPGDNAGLSEISFVDSGSFKGTHWRII